DFPMNTKKIFWSESKMIVVVNDPKGIGNDVKLFLAEKKKRFNRVLLPHILGLGYILR
ncbi:hypothetical protein LEP1GSC170_4681, partial [Leptospira interrogans serovar Bataviae str. HAI135]